MDNQENKKRPKKEEELNNKNNFEDYDDEDDNIEVNYQYNKEKEYNQTYTPHNPNYQAQLPTMNFETENNIISMFNASKILMVIGISYCILLFFLLASTEFDGTVFITYLILAGIVIFSVYMCCTMLKCLALTLHQTHEMNKKLNQLIKTQKKK